MTLDHVIKRIAIFGSTGSVGIQALEVIASNPDKFSVEVLTANNNDELLIQQALKFNPNIVVIGDENKYAGVKEALASTDVKVFAGEKALEEIGAVIRTHPGAIVFTLSPVRIDELLSAANQQRILPPKATWVVPKVPYGILINRH